MTRSQIQTRRNLWAHTLATELLQWEDRSVLWARIQLADAYLSRSKPPATAESGSTAEHQ